MKSKLIKYLKITLVNLVVLLTLLSALEFALTFWNVFPQAGIKKYGYERYLALNEFIPKVEANTYIKKIKVPELITTIEIKGSCEGDSNGFLSPAFRVKSAQKRILLLGDAQSCNLDLLPKQRLHYQLGLYLNQNDTQKVELLNAAFPGNDLIHSTNKVVNIILPLRPDAIIINHNLSDLIQLLQTGSYWGNIIGDKKKARVWTQEFEKPAVSANVTEKQVLSQYSKALQNLSSLLKNWHIEPIFTTQPLNYADSNNLKLLAQSFNAHVSYHDLLNLHQSTNQKIKQVCMNQNIKYIDLAQRLSNEEKYFSNYLLLNVKGVNQAITIIGDSIAKWNLDQSALAASR